MFVKIKKYPSGRGRALSLCRSVRDGKRVRQERIKYIGVAHTEAEFQALLKLANAEIRRLESGGVLPSKKSADENECGDALLGNMKEVIRLCTGIYDVFGVAFDRLSLSTMFSRIRYEQLKAVTLARIAKPLSKLKTTELLQKHFKKQLSVDQIYRLMDTLAPHETAIKTCIFNTSKSLLQKPEATLLFFDVTTLYCESQVADELRDFGYSKDHKAGEVQVVLALATTEEGLPMGYCLFPGNTAEVTTLIKCIEEWRATLNITNVTVVGDRGMMSEKNLAAMDKLQIKYVIAAKLKSLPKKQQETILKRHNEAQVSVGKDTLFVQEHACGKRRLVVSYGEKRANKDRKDRERLLKKIHTKFDKDGKAETAKLISNRGLRKYIASKKDGEVILDQEKIAEDAKWDGLHGVITNDPDMSAPDLLTTYKRQWVVEESFRINKHTLAMRPLYHFKPDRIKAHILICYLAFALARYVQLQMVSFGLNMSVGKIRDTLNEVEVSIFEDTITGEQYRVPSKVNKEAELIYKALGISLKKHPGRLSRKNVV